MDAYTTLVLVAKILAAIYLIVIPWMLGFWMFVPIFTGLGALAATLGVLLSKPANNGNAAVMEHLNNDWAIQLMWYIGYSLYYILAVVLTIFLQVKWFEAQDRKKLKRRYEDYYADPIDGGVYTVRKQPTPSRPFSPVKRQITARPHNWHNKS